jgi:hypothetical protein
MMRGNQSAKSNLCRARGMVQVEKCLSLQAQGPPKVLPKAICSSSSYDTFMNNSRMYS